MNKIESSANKEDLRKRFEQFGPVQNISLHFRDNGSVIQLSKCSNNSIVIV